MDSVATVLLFLCLILGIGLLGARSRLLRLQRERFIRNYVFSASLLATLHKHHSHLVEKDYFLVARALREFFLVRARAGDRFIGMPSKVVDDLWHKFILNTKAYAHFCNSGFGRFFHHIPAAATPKGGEMSNALRITWRYACLEENINPANASRLPLLFAIDAKLKIEKGFTYSTRFMMAEKSDSSGCGGIACSGGGDGCAVGGCAGDAGGGGDGGSCGGGCGGGD